MTKRLKPKISETIYKIYIDTTNKGNKSVYLLKLANKSTTIVEKIQGNIDVVATIQALLTNHNLTPKDLVEIEPNPGPGSFTGVKIGVTIANVFNWANTNTANSSKNHYYKPIYGAEPTITPRLTV